MDSVVGKAAFITGAAGGIGFELSRELGTAGARVILADIDLARAEASAKRLRNMAVDAVAIQLDVISLASWEQALVAARRLFGNIQILCNNAGCTGSMGLLTEEITQEGWVWARSVNLDGVMNGLRTFLPHMKAHAEPSHIVNTASFAGLVGFIRKADYGAAKFGVVGLSEVLLVELEQSDIGVTVLAPGPVKTSIIENSRAALPAAVPPIDALATRAELHTSAVRAMLREGLDPAVVARLALRAILDNQFYVFTDPVRQRPQLISRIERLQQGLDWSVQTIGDLGTELEANLR